MRMRTSLPSKNDAPWARSKLFSQRFLVSALASALLISSSAIRHLIGCLIAIVEGSVSFRPNRWAFILGVWPDTEVAALNANNGLRAQNPCTGVSRIRAFTTPQTMKARDLSRAFFLSRLLGGEQKRANWVKNPTAETLARFYRLSVTNRIPDTRRHAGGAGPDMNFKATPFMQ
jgi:hypothetical protein